MPCRAEPGVPSRGIRTRIPDGPFDIVIWDAAIEHFTEDGIPTTMHRIQSVLVPNGLPSVYTLPEAPHGRKSLHQHEYEFHGKKALPDS